MNKILCVKNMTYVHRSIKGLFDPLREFRLGPINFDMFEGETIAIIGHNGSGKTLTGKLLAGAEEPTSGSIEFIQDDSENAAVKKHPIRMILQHSANVMNPAVAVGAMLHNTLRLNTSFTESERQQKIEDTLKMVGLLADHFYYYRHMLSDGQQQRVALARALILDPKIIVADEPFAALDPSVRSQTVNLILKLQQELGLGFVFISHNIGIVRHVSDKVIVMDKGKIIEQGKTSEVFAEPQAALTKKLLKAHFDLVERHFSLL
ncbi:ATP-binding cassette domain-containing protein [Glaciecola sp. 2405UD65-10]|uniref:ATP-binding cassette domain-containing protein n=1 Tax=Glaciecola sp. 2405UD65-10 TaxID=3397244 RepID=UPI003B59BD20